MQTEAAKTVRETAEELGLSPATLRAWIRERRIGYIRLGRAVRVPASEIRRLIERGTVPAIRGERS
jgi:excisionase family DNA binding protein